MNKQIEKAKTKIQEAKNSVIRTQRMDNNEENKLIMRELHYTIAPKGSPRRIKDSSIMQIIRLVSEDIHQRPLIMAQQEAGESELIPRTVDSVVNRLKSLGEYDKAVRNALTDATNREGSSFIMVVPTSIVDRSDKKNPKYFDRLEYRNIDSANFFKDPAARDVSDSDWIGVRYEFSNEEAKNQLELLYKYKGDIAFGDVLSINDKKASGDNSEDLLADRTAVYEFWNKATQVRIVFAGMNGEVVQMLEGDDYPLFNRFGQAELPVAQLDATPFKFNGYALSYIDVAKDITEQKKRQFNQVLPYFDRVSNQLLAITGITPLEDIAAQIQDAEEYQAQGMVPFLSLTDPNAKVTPVFPSDITAPLERIRNIFTDELGDRLGLDLRINREASGAGVPTATQIDQRKATHVRAISNINNINIDNFYKRLSHLTLDYARALWDDTDDRKIVINKGGQSEYILPLGEAIQVTKDWKGDFEVDTSVESNLNRNEQIIVVQEIKQNFLKDLQIPALSEAEIKPLADTMKAHIKLVGMDKYYQDNEVDAFYSAIIERGRAQKEQEAMMAQLSQKNLPTTPKQGKDEPLFEGRKGATRSTPSTQVAAANMGAMAPQPK